MLKQIITAATNDNFSCTCDISCKFCREQIFKQDTFSDANQFEYMFSALKTLFCLWMAILYENPVEYYILGRESFTIFFFLKKAKEMFWGKDGKANRTYY